MTTLTLNKAHIIETYNYQKHDGARNGSSKRQTGIALKLNECDNILVIDVDIKHNLSEDVKNEERDKFMNALNKYDDIVVSKTGNGGLHIWTLADGFVSGNRNTKWFKSENYDIDLFNSNVDKDKRSLIVLPPTKIRNELKQIVQYTFIKGGMDTVISVKAKDVIDTLEDEGLIENKEKNEKLLKLLKEIQENKDKFAGIVDAADFVNNDDETAINNETVESKEYMKELKVIKGFQGVKIHNDAGDRSIQKEITLLTLFQALNALPEKIIDYAYEYIKHNAKLTTSALDKWDSARTRYMGKKSSSYLLVKMLKIHNNSYYEQELKAIYDVPVAVKDIDRNDEFSWEELVENCETDKYTSPNEAVNDMTRLMRVCDNENIFWMVKNKDRLFRIVSDETQHKKLFRIKCCGTNLWQLYLDNSRLFRIKGIAFKSNEQGIFNIFRGYKYEAKQNDELLAKWTSFVKEIICSNNEELYAYVQHWVSFIINNPGEKIGTALFMGGLQGIGKGTFIECLCRLFEGYINANITNMNELSGEFNTAIEGNVICVGNELKNVGDERAANFDCLKSLITEKVIRYNEKGIPRRDGENVANFIFMSNNPYAIKIEVDDRRYVAINVNPSKRGDSKYWSELHNLIKNDEFIQAIMFDYIKNYNDTFDLHVIPQTQERKDLMDASKSDIVIMIEEHYKDFVKGTIIYDNWKKDISMKPKTFGIQIAKYCDKKRSRTRDETYNKYVYTLKAEWKELLEDNQTEDANDEEIDKDAL